MDQAKMDSRLDNNSLENNLHMLVVDKCLRTLKFWTRKVSTSDSEVRKFPFEVEKYRSGSFKKTKTSLLQLKFSNFNFFQCETFQLHFGLSNFKHSNFNLDRLFPTTCKHAPVFSSLSQEIILTPSKTKLSVNPWLRKEFEYKKMSHWQWNRWENVWLNNLSDLRAE